MSRSTVYAQRPRIKRNTWKDNPTEAYFLIKVDGTLYELPTFIRTINEVIGYVYGKFGRVPFSAKQIINFEGYSVNSWDY